MEESVREKIARFEEKNRQVRICYGGDGTLVSEWRRAQKDKKVLLPIRNYGQCPEHAGFLDDLLNRPEKFGDAKRELKMTLHPPVRCEFGSYDSLALSEFLVTNADITEALRFDVLVNGEKYLGNVVATSFLVSSAFGATGYWSSVTRTIFREGFGMAFVAPTVGVSNLVLKPTDRAEVRFARGCSAKVSADKEVACADFSVGDVMRFETSCENVPIFGLAQFHCNTCRAGRSGTVLANQYLK